jgi:hypothetical protein
MKPCKNTHCIANLKDHTGNGCNRYYPEQFAACPIYMEDTHDDLKEACRRQRVLLTAVNGRIEELETTMGERLGPEKPTSHDKISPLHDIFIVVTERDHPDPFKSSGALAMETYTGKADLCDAVERAKSIGDRYGQVFICKLVSVGDVETCENLVNKPC